MHEQTENQTAASVQVDFVQAMRRMTSSVTIVTTSEAGVDFGMTATAVCSLTMDPPALLICVNRNASICRWLVPDQPFCVNLLSEGHDPVAGHFAGRTAPEERFRHGDWTSHGQRVPYLRDAHCNIFCAVDNVTEYGTHAILIGRVEGVRLPEDRNPLLYRNGTFLTPVSSS